MYFFSFPNIAALLKVSSCLLTRTTSPMTAVNPLRAAENPLSIPVTGCGRCAGQIRAQERPPRQAVHAGASQAGRGCPQANAAAGIEGRENAGVPDTRP